MTVPTLTRRALNRATLARQMLQSRHAANPVEAIERLVGLQAQLARPPFIGLWSRLERFQRADLTRRLHSREVVRATLLRGALHLVSARDFLAFRASLQPMLTRGMRAALRERADALDVNGLVAEARAVFDERPRAFEALRDLLVKRYPEGDERAMGYAVRMHLPLVQVPTDDPWGYPGSTDFTLAESWLGRSLRPGDARPRLVLRYLAAFGPATVSDAQTWSGLQGLREVFEALKPELRAFRDERGRDLYDLPDAPRPSEATEAPVRFLPEFDDLVMGHDDRTRLIADAHRSAIFKANLRILPTFLVDGFVAGTWEVTRKRKSAMLALKPFAALAKKARHELGEEGNALVRFVEADAETFDVRFAAR